MRVLSFDVGIKNMSYIDIEYLNGDVSFRLHNWGIMDISEGTSLKDLNGLASNLVKALQSQYPSSLNASFDYVIIENQPALRNPIMKSLQMIIYTYFLNDKLNASHKLELKMINATNKLKVTRWTDKETIENLQKDLSGLASGYTKRKKLSVALCATFLNKHQSIIEDYNKWQEFFKGHKKKDDLSDTLNMCLYFLHNAL